METATTAGAGAMLTSPLWLSAADPYLKALALVMGISWIAIQMYYKVKNERKKSKDGS